VRPLPIPIRQKMMKRGRISMSSLNRKKWQAIGYFAGMVVGCVSAYALLGFSPPEGILILFCAATAGLIGIHFDQRKSI